MPENIQAPKQSHWLRNIITLIIVLLLIWEFVLPNFIVIKTPSEYVKDYFFVENPDNTYHIFLINQTTGQRQDFTGYIAYETTMAQYHTYDIGIASDIPVYLTGNYKMDLRIEFWNTTSNDWELGGLFINNIPGYEPLYKHEWRISQNQLFLNYETAFIITIKLLDVHGLSIIPDGGITSSVNRRQVLRINDFLETPP